MKKAIAALISFAAIAFSQSAIAATANRDQLNNIVISNTGLPPNTLIEINYFKLFNTLNFSTSGACNLLTIKRKSNFGYEDFIKVNGTQLDLSRSDVPTLSAPACLKGLPNPAYTWTTVGSYKYIQGQEKIYVLAPNAGQFSVQGDLARVRLGKVDGCGRISIKNSDKWPMTGLDYGDGTLTYKQRGAYGVDVQIPTTTSAAMPICYRGMLYKPLN